MAEKYSGRIAEAEDRLADRMLRRIEEMERIAEGDAPSVEEVWEPAGLVTVDEVILNGDGEPILDKNGKPSMGKRLLRPDLPPDELVLVSRKVVRAGPDRQANEYLINRIMGKPTERTEHTGQDGEPIELTATVRSAAAIEIESWRADMKKALPPPATP